LDLHESISLLSERWGWICTTKLKTFCLELLAEVLF
jgi:hypothetical protein